jgi:hypothetical protein
LFSDRRAQRASSIGLFTLVALEAAIRDELDALAELGFEDRLLPIAGW